MKKKIIMLLAVSMLASIFASGCNNTPNTVLDDEQQNDDQQNGNDGTYDTAVLPEAVYTEADSNIAMTISGVPISEAEYRYYLLGLRKSYGGTDVAVWEQATLDTLKEMAAIEIMVADNGITMTSELTEAFNSMIVSIMEQFNNTEGTSYENELAQFNMTDVFYRDLAKTSLLGSVLYEEYAAEDGAKHVHASDEEILAYAAENYVRVKHILIKTTEMDDAQKAQARVRAENLVAQARGGASFEELVTANSEDGMDVEIGYYFTYGEMVEPFENASFALKVGEVSDIVESTYGYHIIKKYEMEDEYLLSDETIRSAVSSGIAAEIFDADVNAVIDSLEIEYSDNYEQIKAKILAEGESNDAADSVEVAE